MQPINDDHIELIMNNFSVQDLIQSQLFHLIAMLICIGVVVWLFVRHFASYSKEIGDAENRLRRMNTLYISGILVFIIIELVTALCMGNSKHAEILSFVSFAATLSSLIMSVVAIIFTIVSTKRGEEQYLKLGSASNKIHSALKSFKQETIAIEATIDKFQSISNGLMDGMSLILDRVNAVDNKASSILNGLPENASEKSDTDTKGTLSAQNVDRFLKIGSFNGNIALYACVLSKKKERKFTFTELWDSRLAIQYKMAYIVSAIAIGVIEGKVDRDGWCIISDYYKGLDSLLEDVLKKYIEKKDGEAKTVCQKEFDHVVDFFK